MDDDIGEMDQFQKPAMLVTRWLDENPRYSETVAESLRPEIERIAVTVGKKLLVDLEQMGRRISDKYGDAIMDAVRGGLRSNLPPEVDQSELDEAEDPFEEVWDDTFYESSSDACSIFILKLLPYVLSSAIKFGEGLDYGMPWPVSDEIRDKLPNVEVPADDPPVAQ